MARTLDVNKLNDLVGTFIEIHTGISPGLFIFKPFGFVTRITIMFGRISINETVIELTLGVDRTEGFYRQQLDGLIRVILSLFKDVTEDEHNTIRYAMLDCGIEMVMTKGFWSFTPIVLTHNNNIIESWR